MLEEYRDLLTVEDLCEILMIGKTVHILCLAKALFLRFGLVAAGRFQKKQLRLIWDRSIRLIKVN